MIPKNALRNMLLNCNGESAANITHAISAYGDGKMADGLNRLWINGQNVGAIKALGLVGAVVGVYAFVKQQIVDYQTRKAIRAICDEKACAIDAQSEESEQNVAEEQK